MIASPGDALLSVACLLRVGVVAPTLASDRAALVELYVATGASVWTTKVGWQSYANGSDPCDNTWSGVTCSGVIGGVNRVV
jgi:hypothetical protein